MECPSCGSLIESDAERCLDCRAATARNYLGYPEANLAPNGAGKRDGVDDSAFEVAPRQAQTSRLIEFPGVSKSSLPQWRKELSERVREVQEKRAREAAREKVEEERRYKRESAASTPQLELLPQADPPPLNPIVSAALRRIERAHQQVTPSDGRHGVSAMAAVACAGESESGDESRRGVEVDCAVAAVDFEEFSRTDLEVEPQPADKVHNLVVVPPRVADTQNLAARTRPRRMISDDPNDPALNYLDSVPTAIRVEAIKHLSAPPIYRLLAAIVDLLVVTLFCAPFAAAVELLVGSWQSWLVATSAAGILSVASFLYLTISTALTGRTLGTRLLSLRIVDCRTGLIPTGKQSAGRALIYLATLMTLGLPAIYTLINSDKRTPHDHLTSTAVIEV